MYCASLFCTVKPSMHACNRLQCNNIIPNLPTSHGKPTAFGSQVTALVGQYISTGMQYCDVIHWYI